jgi:hypothetical protein
MIIINKLSLVSLVLYMDIMGNFSLPPLVSRRCNVQTYVSPSKTGGLL